MPQLFVAPEFFESYESLDKPIRKAARAAITKFSEHTHAGLHLKKLAGARDPRLRTIRITRGWRGVVLALPSGDQYCLVKIVNHDVADRELASRRYTVNQVLGILEVRDQDAIETLTPEFAQAAQTAEHRLFEGYKNSELTELGLDPDLLPTVRALTSQQQLDALAKVIPNHQHNILVALASGMSKEEVWQEVCEYLVDTPAEVDPDDLAAAIERTPDQYRLVSGPEELSEMLAKPFAAWKIFLHRRQQDIAYRPSYN